MPPGIALVVFVIGIAGLFFLDRDRERRSSPALWLPVIWLCIAGSRMVSQWLYPTPSNQPADAYLDGSPLDRVLLTALLAAALLVLAGRGARLGPLLRANGPIICFFLYCGVSTLWSDYPDVAFKRWMKAVGDLAMVMVVLTSPDPLAALKRVVSRTAFLLIPLSVLLIKYYPELGRGYNQWNWGSFYVGVATEKNGLGYICLILGLGSLWRLTTMHDTAEIAGRRNQRIAHGVVLAMAMWLFWKADSVTALLCFFLGTSLLLLASVPGWQRAPGRVLVTTIALSVAVGILLESGGGLAASVGRDTTLTGRTQLWNDVLKLTVDPLFGTGFESFWLGERVERIWKLYWWRPNQSHNGYIELFLNLGATGLTFLAAAIVLSYRKIGQSFRAGSDAAKLRLAYLVVAIVFNLTEAAFKGFHPVWIAFLFAVTDAPASRPPQRDADSVDIAKSTGARLEVPVGG